MGHSGTDTRTLYPILHFWWSRFRPTWNPPQHVLSRFTSWDGVSGATQNALTTRGRNQEFFKRKLMEVLGPRRAATQRCLEQGFRAMVLSKVRCAFEVRSHKGGVARKTTPKQKHRHEGSGRRTLVRMYADPVCKGSQSLCWNKHRATIPRHSMYAFYAYIGLV